jgi:hypothetical protein
MGLIPSWLASGDAFEQATARHPAVVLKALWDVARLRTRLGATLQIR